MVKDFQRKWTAAVKNKKEHESKGNIYMKIDLRLTVHTHPFLRLGHGDKNEAETFLLKARAC